MPKTDPRHLSDEQLLLYFDNELAAAARDAARRHIDGCWTCRTRLDDLSGAVSAIVHARESLFDSLDVPSNLAWPGLARRIAETRVPPSRGFRPARFRAIAVAAGVLLAGWIFTVTRPTLTAGQVLANASAAAWREIPNPRAVVHQRFHVERRRVASGRSFAGDYELWRGPSNTRFQLASLGPEIGPSLRRAYGANRLDWNDPLAAAPIAQWHGRLSSASDSVVEDAGRVTVTTQAPADAPASAIRRAELVLRRADWHPLELRLTLAEDEFAIREVSSEVVDSAAVDASLLPAEPIAPALPPTPPAAPLPALVEFTPPVAASFNPLATQMAVLWSIHQLGADLAEPVQVFCCFAGDVVLEAAGVPDSRLEQLRAIATANPHTRFDSDGAISPPQQSSPDAAPPPLPDSPADPSLDSRLSDFFGSFEARENFTRAILAQSDALLTRAYALRKLAADWPAALETTLDPASRAHLDAMAADHSAAAANAAREAAQLLDPLAAALTVSYTPQSSPSAEHWQDAIPSLFSRAREADSLIRLVFTRNDRPPMSRAALERLCSLTREMAGALADLRQSIPVQP